MQAPLGARPERNGCFSLPPPSLPLSLLPSLPASLLSSTISEKQWKKYPGRGGGESNTPQRNVTIQSLYNTSLIMSEVQSETLDNTEIEKQVTYSKTRQPMRLTCWPWDDWDVKIVSILKKLKDKISNMLMINKQTGNLIRETNYFMTAKWNLPQN